MDAEVLLADHLQRLKARRRLSKAWFECRRKVADTVVAGGTVEAVAGGALLEQAGVERVAEAKRLG